MRFISKRATATMIENRRKLASLAAWVAAVLIAGFAATGCLVAQEGKFSHIYSTQTGDAEVVAVVNGIEVTREQVRKTPAFLQENQPGLTEDEAIILSIVGQIDRYILLSEVQRRGLMPTVEEAREFMEPHKQACLGPQGADCRARTLEAGQNPDDEAYWNSLLPKYREDLGIIRLVEAHFAEIGLTPGKGTNEERVAARAAFVEELRTRAEIVWQDQRLANLYREALSPEGEKFRREQYEKAISSR